MNKKYVYILACIFLFFGFNPIQAQDSGYYEMIPPESSYMISVSTGNATIENHQALVLGLRLGRKFKDNKTLGIGIGISNAIPEAIDGEIVQRIGRPIDGSLFYSEISLGTFGDWPNGRFSHSADVAIGFGSLNNRFYGIRPSFSTFIFQPDFIIFMDITKLMQLGLGAVYRASLPLTYGSEQHANFGSANLGFHLRFSKY